MGPKKDVIDIISRLGGIESAEGAARLFSEKMDSENLEKIQVIKAPEVLKKIANAAALCRPDAVFVNTGSDSDYRFVKELSLRKGEEDPLPIKEHTIHFDLKEEQGRIIDRTFYISNEGETVNSLAKRKDRGEALEEIREMMGGIMQGMVMMVGFYLRGPLGSPVSNPALEITSSAYVMHSADILYRNIYRCFENELRRQRHFYTNIHSEGKNRPDDLPNARVFMCRSHYTTYSFNCTYAGNTLLLKKGNHRFSVDRAVYENFGNELSEHMFITGLDGPGGRVTWMTGAAPSGCGKTTTAMAGSHFIGDDLAQMWIADDGSIRSVNPEKGIFGIVEDVNEQGDPLLMQCLRQPGTEVIWSNVLIDENGAPQWVGNGQNPAPQRGRNFQGAWERGMKDAAGKEIPLSHPNSRCTLRSSALANYSELAENGAGVETRIVTYSGRDSDTMPPVWVAKNPDHGVVIGACIVSAATATEVGATGVRRAPWANAPFIPGALGDYMKAQFAFFNSPRIASGRAPIMAGLNYFLTEAARGGQSRQLLGEKRDVKAWMGWLERRAHGEVGAIETPIGLLPEYDDLKRLFKAIIDKEYPEDLYTRQFSLYLDNILARVDLQLEAYGKEDRIPEKLFTVLNEQRRGLESLRSKFGPVVLPSDLRT
jgi:phosphoenolpyruvate carboxykinase (GTP)